MSKNPDVVSSVTSTTHVAPPEWHDHALVLELEALLDARKALMQELLVLDAQVASHFARLLPDATVPSIPLGMNGMPGTRIVSAGASNSISN